jgi:membrane protein DedA with SNARE-associated domain
MDFTEFIRDYGYVAIVVGTFFEGELIMLAAGMAASAGLLSLPWAIAAGIAGIFFSDTVCSAGWPVRASSAGFRGSTPGSGACSG